MRKILFLMGKNLYDTKIHFSTKLAEAFQRQGIETCFFNFLQTDPWGTLKSFIQREKPDLCCTFYPADLFVLEAKFWDALQVPLWSIITDPPLGWEHVPRSPRIFYSCCDHGDCAYLKKHGVENVFFWGHGVERDLIPPQDSERPYDVVYLGTSYDPTAWKAKWKMFPEPVQKAMDTAVFLYLSDNVVHFSEAVDRALQQHHVDLGSLRLPEIYYFVSVYCHGWDRLELIRSVKDATVHVFGGSVFRAPKKARGWSYDLADRENVIIHPAISFTEAIEVMKKSKICLNSMPFFKQGTHDRLFTAAACECLVVNTDTAWVREHFQQDRDLLLYTPLHWIEVNDKINYFLTHDKERQEMAKNGRQKVMQSHTWDHRVQEALAFFKL